MKGSVIAVSVSAPRWIDMNGVRTFTSIVREPSPVPLHFGAEGPDGNALAVHTETTYAFPIEHYDFWAREFGVDRAAWPHCFWGENLTLAGLHEDRLRVGDRLRFARGTLLEVTGARTPCTKLSWRLGLPGAILKRLTSKGWLGFYLRVIEPGLIGAGDAIEVTTPYPTNITVGDLGRLLDRGTGGDPVLIQQASEMPAISEQNKDQLLHTIDHVRDLDRARIGRWSGWRPFIVRERSAAAQDITSFRLEAQDGQPVAPYRAGQFLPVRLSGRDGSDVVRNWSISEYDEEASGYRITIKRIPGGVGSVRMHDDVTVGDVVQLRPPSGRFTLERSGLRPVVLISAGIGATPLMSMLRSHAAGRKPTPLTWLHSTRCGATHVLKEEVAALIKGHSAFTSRIYYSQPRDDDRRGADYDVAGRISKADLAALVEQPSRYQLVTREIELNGRTRDFYICGPQGFEAMVRQALLELGVQAHLILSESFSPAATTRHGEVNPETAQVTFSRSGVHCTWSREHYPSLLESAETAGLTPDFGCRQGSCGACEAQLVTGQVEHNPRPAGELGPQRVLLCCARPASPQVVIDI